MNNQIQNYLNNYKVTEIQIKESKKSQELKEFRYCSSNRCHPAKCLQYENCR
jgi:hypothetical protein